MNIMNIQQVMKLTKYAALLAIGLRTSSVTYRLFQEYQLTRPLKCKGEYDFYMVWESLIYNEGNITPQTISDIFDRTLKVGSKDLIQITEYMQKQRRFFGWKYTQYCIQNVIQEFNRKIKQSRAVIKQMLEYKGYNYQAFDEVAFQGMNNNQIILQLNLYFECKVFQQFAQFQEQLNKEGIFYYMDKFLDLLTKNKEEIQSIKSVLIHNNQMGFKQLIYQSYIHDKWYLSFGFEYQVLADSIHYVPMQEREGIFKQRELSFSQQLDKMFE
ncbi:hypothetical protein pb186bvf_015021 [Paramecium bursaria]